MSIENKVKDLLQENGIQFNVVFCGATNKDDWDCDAWVVTFSKPRKVGDPKWREGVTESFNYFTGVGHRDKRGEAKKPDVSEVLHALIYDGEFGDETFEDFCIELGYDTDSRKALENYLQCQKNGAKLRKVLGSKLLDELENLIQYL